MPLNRSFLDFKLKFDNKVVTVRSEIIKSVAFSILGISALFFGDYLDSNYSGTSIECYATSFSIGMISIIILIFCYVHILSLLIAYKHYKYALSEPNYDWDINYEANIIVKDVDLNTKDDIKESDDKVDIDALVEEQPKKIYYVCSHCGNKVYNNLSKDYFNFGQSCPLCGNIMKEVNEETN